jgi:hypothetical protein
MDATVGQLGDVVIEALRVAGYMESTIGQYERTIRYLTGFVAGRGGVYTPALGATAAITTAPTDPLTEETLHALYSLR